jgi:SAM-dependent methyltransferase
MAKLANHILVALCLVSHRVLALAFLPVPSNVPGYRMPLTLGSMAEKVLENPKFPDEWPYTDETDFSRQDESKDTIFYDTPRLCYHIDDDAVSALTKYYSENLKEGDDVLDICSSWVSHYPKDFKGGKVVGLGMNEYELSQNPQLTDFVVKDLNADPVFPFEDSSFDKVTCVVSVDYLNKPLQVFKEIGRVLRPGGECLISMSNRCFPTKAFKVSTKKYISLWFKILMHSNNLPAHFGPFLFLSLCVFQQIWLQTNDLEHIFITGSFFHYSDLFDAPSCSDISPNPGRTDPLYIVKGVRKA